MKTILILVFTLLVGFVNAQTKLKPLTDEEIMYPDKLNETLVPWTKEQKDAFMINCESKTTEIIENNKSYCKCAMKSMMTGVNYERYDKLTDYQKGKLTSMHGNLNCKAIRKEE